MQQVSIPNTDVRCSKFVFGTSGLIRILSRRSRLSLLDAAVANGFSHFDTAPYYGFGVAEKDVGEVLRRNCGVTITTKLGLYSPGGEAQSAFTVVMRKMLGKFIKNVSEPIADFTIKRANDSLEGSLRRLGRDHIDVYLLHEPEVTALHVDEWVKWFESAVAAGKVGAFGIALTAERLRGFLESDAQGLMQVIQVVDSLDNREADILRKFGRPFQFTYGYISGAKARGVTTPVRDLLKSAILRNDTGAIVIGTTHKHRLEQYSAAAERLN